MWNLRSSTKSDGRSFSNRRVVAIQHGRPILNLAASFQEPEEGLKHQAEMPDVPGPEGLKDLTEIAKDMLEFIPSKMRRFMTDKRPFEFRHVEPVDFEVAEKRSPIKQSKPADLRIRLRAARNSNVAAWIIIHPR